MATTWELSSSSSDGSSTNATAITTPNHITDDSASAVQERDDTTSAGKRVERIRNDRGLNEHTPFDPRRSSTMHARRFSLSTELGEQHTSSSKVEHHANTAVVEDGVMRTSDRCQSTKLGSSTSEGAAGAGHIRNVPQNSGSFENTEAEAEQEDSGGEFEGVDTNTVDTDDLRDYGTSDLDEPDGEDMNNIYTTTDLSFEERYARALTRNSLEHPSNRSQHDSWGSLQGRSISSLKFDTLELRDVVDDSEDSEEPPPPSEEWYGNLDEGASSAAPDTGVAAKPSSKRDSSRSRSSSSLLKSQLRKGWKAVKRSSVKSTASASKQLSSLSSSYWKAATTMSSLSSASSVRPGSAMSVEERAAWEERQSRICEEWLTSILPCWEKKRKAARTRDLAFRGIPPSVRGKVWVRALGNPLNVPPDLFGILRDRARAGRLEYLRFRETLDKADGDVGGHGGQAEPLIVQERSGHKAIMLDLPRTFPELAFFHADGSEYEDALREILEAFMYLRPDIGYSQGMSFLAAVLLLYVADGSEAFGCFVNMLLYKSCFLHFFGMKMPEVRIYLSVHDRFLREELPLVHGHFKEQGVDAELYMINWVMSLYCGALPLDLVSRIWDIYVLDGDVAIFRAALGILKLLAGRLLGMKFEGIAYLLSHLPGEEMDGDVLLRTVRGVQSVTKRRFREAFRSCRARYLLQEQREQQEREQAASASAAAMRAGECGDRAEVPSGGLGLGT